MKYSFDRYWAAIKQSFFLVSALSAGAALVAYLVVQLVGITYEVHFSYLLSLTERESSEDFRFDGYYALQATDLFAATVTEWLSTPEVVVAAFREGGLPLPTREASGLRSMVEARKTAPQLIEVTIRHKDEAIAQSLAQSIQAVMAENITRYHDQGIPALRFKVVATEPWLGVASLKTSVVVGSTLVFAWLLLVNGVVLKESFRELE